MHEHNIELKLAEICEAVDIPEQTFIKLVEYGIVQPGGDQVEEWSFDLTMVSVAKRATRLQRDLELDWAAVAIVEQLLEEREQLQSENELLRQQLQRFLQDPE